MKLIRRDWTPKEADNWTKEDIIASILSALAYLSYKKRAEQNSKN